MIVRHFLDWVRTAPAGKRAEATGALARAYLYSDLSPDDLAAAEGAMLMLLDDASPLVRRALADALAASPSAPPAIVLALAADQPQIAAPVLALSPLFVDADLVDAVATGNDAVQAAIASRAALPRPVAAAIAEVGTAEACLVLVGKSRRRHRAVLDRSDRRALRPSGGDSRAAAGARGYCGGDAADAGRQTVGDAGRLRRRARMARCRSRPAHRPRGLREGDGDARRGDAERRRCGRWSVICASSGQLTAGLILRALLSGNVVLFEEALAELTDMPVERVSSLVHDSGNAGLRALFEPGQMPPSTYPAFKEAIEAMREGGPRSASRAAPRG